MPPWNDPDADVCQQRDEHDGWKDPQRNQCHDVDGNRRNFARDARRVDFVVFMQDGAPQPEEGQVEQDDVELVNKGGQR